ncbi:MAG: 5-(carboxyamino)imidazole ribonucleotide synthase [Hyphomicrobiales bacterium]|nr:5-(carboxyamino)imidazole ribonucleotide synthase [Hyphomicrobiales bacterium]
MLPEGSTIGILGGGQLGWMLSLAAKELGYHCHIFAPEENPPAMQAAAHHTRAGFDNIDKLKTFAKSVDVITYEFENIPVEPLCAIKDICAIHPSLKSLEICQHRLKEKNFVKDLKKLTTPFAEARIINHLPPIFNIELPAFVKTLRMGYDGKGQFVLREREDRKKVPEKLGKGPWIAEVAVDFFQEFAVVVARDKNGNTRCFDAIATYHEGGILRKAKIPSGLHPEFETYAQQTAAEIAEELKHVGVLTVEFFLLRNINGAEDNDGTNASKRVLVNEIAPRVHNSGHLTREICDTDQFKQHIQAICGWSLGDTTRTKNAKMVNLLGDEVKKWEKPPDDPNINVTIYGKGEARPGRKMGHVVWTQPISR